MKKVFFMILLAFIAISLVYSQTDTDSTSSDQRSIGMGVSTGLSYLVCFELSKKQLISGAYLDENNIVRQEVDLSLVSLATPTITVYLDFPLSKMFSLILGLTISYNQGMNTTSQGLGQTFALGLSLGARSFGFGVASVFIGVLTDNTVEVLPSDYTLGEVSPWATIHTEKTRGLYFAIGFGFSLSILSGQFQ